MIENPKVAPTSSKTKTSSAEIAEIEKATGDRIKTLLKYLKKYGVPEQYLFEVNQLKEMTNIPKVTRCIAMVGKMVRNLYLYHKECSEMFVPRIYNFQSSVSLFLHYNDQKSHDQTNSENKCSG